MAGIRVEQVCDSRVDSYNSTQKIILRKYCPDFRG